MIYLIDDNQHNQRLENYKIAFVEEGVFTGYLTSIERLEFKKELNDISHLEFLRNADCVLLHSTIEDYVMEKGFLSGSKTNSLKIKEEISQEGDSIPLVLFSNSMGDPEYDFDNQPNYIRSIKKNLFYERLFDFLEHYKSTKKVELRIIAWGKNYGAKEISMHAREILKALTVKSDSDLVAITDLSLVVESLRSFLEISLPESDMNSIFDQIEDHPMSVADFKKRIKLITESYSNYGKNLHSWEQ